MSISSLRVYNQMNRIFYYPTKRNIITNNNNLFYSVLTSNITPRQPEINLIENEANFLDLSPPKLLSQITRGKKTNISKKRGTLGNRRCRMRGMFREDGEWVSAGTMLVRQLGLLYFPGLNVGLGRNRDLFAMEHGHVMITTEKVNPNWDQKIMHAFFGQYEDRNDVPIYKTYFHVITSPMPQKFKLIDEI